MSTIILTNSLDYVCENSDTRYKVSNIDRDKMIHQIREMCLHDIHSDIKHSFHHPMVIEFHHCQPSDFCDTTSLLQFDALKKRLIKVIRDVIEIDIFEFEPTIHRKQGYTYVVIGKISHGYSSLSAYMASYEKYARSASLLSEKIYATLSKGKFLCLES